MLTNEDMKAIKAEMYDTFVSKESCSNRRDEVNRGMAELNQKFAIANTKQNALIWVSSLIASTTVVELVGRILHLF